MAYIKVQDVVEGRGAPIVSKKFDSVRDALKVMAVHSFSQLPVVDDDMKPLGIISHESVTNALAQFGTTPDALRVSHAMSQAFELFDHDDDFTEMAGRLTTTGRVALVRRDGFLVGIITLHDIASYFLLRALDMMRVQQVEEAVRDHVRSAYKGNLDQLDTGASKFKSRPGQQSQDRLYGTICKYCAEIGVERPRRDDAALRFASGASGKDTRTIGFSDLSFGEYTTMLFDVWDASSGAFGMIGKDELRRLFDRVRIIRNRLAHFKGELTTEEKETLQFCADLLDTHQPDTADEETDAEREPELLSSVESQEARTMAEINIEERGGKPETPSDRKYRPFADHLRALSSDIASVSFTFKEIETIIGAELPRSARSTRVWWANDTGGHSHSREWLDANWRMSRINLSQERVDFRRTNETKRAYIDFYNQVRADISRAAPSLQLARPLYTGSNWHNLINRIHPALPGAPAAYFGCSFTRQGRFRVYMYLDGREQPATKRVFDLIHAQRLEVERELGVLLSWERHDTKRSAIVAVYHEGAIYDDASQLEALAGWVAATFPAFVKVLMERFDAAAAAP